MIDHLVVAAATLDEGVAWCERMLGVAPGPGGTHLLMGTHNRLLSIGTDELPRAYLEIIAINPVALPPAALRARWFGLDDAALQATLLSNGPRLVHWLAAVADINAARASMLALGLDPGVPLSASRETPHGTLKWLITLRDDGRPQLGGALPALIEWGEVHPADAMPPSGVRLRTLQLPAAPVLQSLPALRAPGIEWVSGLLAPRAVLETPRGKIIISMGAPA